LGNDAITAGPQVGDDTKRKGAAAGVLAALWPSSLRPEQGVLLHEENRQIWRRRVTHVALIAALVGIGAVAYAPPYHGDGKADPPQDQAGVGHVAHGGAAGAAGHGEDGSGAERLSIGLRTLQAHTGGPAFTPSADVQTTPELETADDHGEGAAQGPDNHGPHGLWGAYGAAPGFGGGGGFDGGSASSDPLQGDKPSVAGPGDPRLHPTPGGPQTPDQPKAPYTIDPDQGPHQTCDPKCSPPKDWRPQSRPSSPALSPVPEPQTWLMMIVGFGLLGGSLRSRRGWRSAHSPS
jgi:hypothetical protein